MWNLLVLWPWISLPSELCEISCFHFIISPLMLCGGGYKLRGTTLPASYVSLRVLSNPDTFIVLSSIIACLDVHLRARILEVFVLEGFLSSFPLGKLFSLCKIYLPWRSCCWSFRQYQVPYLVRFLKFSPCDSQGFQTITLQALSRQLYTASSSLNGV